MYGLYGKVIKYVPDRGFGIILGDNKQTYLVLNSWLKGEQIEKGDYVFFVPFKNDRGDFNAKSVSVIYTPDKEVREKYSTHKKKNNRKHKSCNADKVIRNDILYKADEWYANKWKRTVFGIGYLGCSDDSFTRDNYIYSKWANMMQRCYDEKTHKLKPYYALCKAEIEWLNFSNYREWHKENMMGDEKVDLDKDVLIQGNTVCGSDTCTLIPHFTNTVFETPKGTDTNIVLNNTTGKYNVTMSILGKNEDVGTFDTEEEAKQGYIDYKQDYIKNFAKKCKGKVPYKTYEAMMNWVVEITD